MTDKDKLKSPAEGATVSGGNGIVARLRHAHATASNDDYSEPLSEKRVRHLVRLSAILEAADYIESTEGEIQRLRTALAKAEARIGRVRALGEAMPYLNTVTTLHRILTALDGQIGYPTEGNMSPPEAALSSPAPIEPQPATSASVPYPGQPEYGRPSMFPYEGPSWTNCSRCPDLVDCVKQQRCKRAESASPAPIETDVREALVKTRAALIRLRRCLDADELRSFIEEAAALAAANLALHNTSPKGGQQPTEAQPATSAKSCAHTWAVCPGSGPDTQECTKCGKRLYWSVAAASAGHDNGGFAWRTADGIAHLDGQPATSAGSLAPDLPVEGWFVRVEWRKAVSQGGTFTLLFVGGEEVGSIYDTPTGWVADHERRGTIASNLPTREAAQAALLAAVRPKDGGAA